MELLLNEMWKRGANRANLKAKAFGGGSILNTTEALPVHYQTVGEVNVRFIREFLQNENIPLVASDLGGEVGRVINFHSGDYSVYVRKMAVISKKIVKREQQHWRKSIRKQELSETEIDLW
jgi:chemotaxis protein CheD